ncbi:ABC-2 type transport system ATP-binding protein [Scopulibacillus darangshiensis]|uniref:ABC-2 type transport system ATP-binding protein n=1 Tax=Scopulibacillus darangshiensis TaxID=442528 RepID=A0A4R2P3C9_9BACL|nr:ABC transporter ATP-binding protein [Scopulibacillus darangshiensis]TCP29289.1 ABC-2 type transport system ATP-binding protein [Scopulibacillus darangshiensis]
MMLSINDVVKRFGNYTAVDHLTLEIPEKQMFGFLGVNGAGKTTTFRMILDLLKPTSGEILWQGRKISYKDSHMIGYLPEERGLYPKLKVSDQLVYLGKLRGMAKSDAKKELKGWLDRFGVSEYYDKRIEELSKGNQQKIQFIAAVIHKPKLLILDEPFSGLDPVNVEVLKRAVIELKDQGVSILFSSHRMDHVEELCEHLCIMDRGKPLLTGSLKGVKGAYRRKTVFVNGDFNTADLVALPGVLGCRKDNRGAYLKIENEAVSQEIFQELAKKGFVRSFAIEEPSLNDIFIDKVGRANE